jgi:transcriptional regulator with XRE-family HTH domain
MGLDGDKIRELRISRNLTQFEFSLEIDTDQQYVSRIELNRHNISLNTACKIADFFGCTIDELLKK